MNFFLLNVFKFFSRFFLNFIKILKLNFNNSSCQFYLFSDITGCKFGRYVVVFKDCTIVNSKIDSFSYVQIGSRIFNCEIGKFCSIAPSVTIAPGLHDINMVSTHPSFVQVSTPLPRVFAKENCITSFKKVVIGNDVWIGEKAIIMDGVVVGDGAVIGSGAVVVKNVDPYSIVGGVPAKHIKYRFDEETISVIQKSEWWNFTEDLLEEKAHLFINVNDFLNFRKNAE